MNSFAVSSLITGILSLGLALFVFTRKKSFKLNRLWAKVSFVTALWSFGLFGVTFFNAYSLAYVSQIVLDIAGIFIPILFFNFVVVLIDKVDKIKKWLRACYFIAIALSILSVTPYFKEGLEPVFNFQYWIQPGPAYWAFPVFFLILAVTSVYLLIVNGKRSVGIKKQQIRYVLYSAFFGFGGGIFNFLPQFSQIYPIGNYLVGFYVITITYAIAKYRLMNIKLVVTRSILYAVLVGSVASFFAFSIFYIGPMVAGDNRNSRIISTIVSSILIVLFLDPVKRVWARITDSIFYKDRIDYQKVLRKSSDVIAREIDLDDLLDRLVKLLADRLKLKKVSVFIPSDEHFSLKASSGQEKQEVYISSELIEYFNHNRGLLITEELIRQRDDLVNNEAKKKELGQVIEELEKIDGEMMVPIIENDKVTALFVLSNKLSGDVFDSTDLDFFKLLSSQVATAIEKSKLYEEVQELNRDLQAKVEERTKSLEQANVDLEARNRYLITMQKVINMVSRTLDLKKVTQMIADSIASELGYIGGVLSFVNGDNRLRVKAVTQNHKSKKAIDLLPEDIFTYEAELKAGYNLGVDTVLSSKINFSTDMTEFFSPPVKEEIIKGLQAHLGVKTVVGVPIFSEDKIIGVIHFLLAVEREQISSLDIEMMTSLTNQVGIVARNLELYENVQKVNKDLHEANTHLKVLDKAKSEFLSIASHQLRTPVSAIKGYLSMMLDGDFGKIPDNISKIINDLFESASRLARTINIFLNVSRIEAGRLKLEKHAMQIDDMIDSVITELINSAASKNIKLIYNKPKQTPPLIYADSDKLREVVLNLIDNAIKYTPEGSVEVSLEFDDKNLTFISKDTGIGINPEEARTLFRKFVRGDGVAQIHTGGSGLGLFIAQKITKEHNGRIWVESEGKSKGSVFKFEVPLATEQQIVDTPKQK